MIDKIYKQLGLTQNPGETNSKEQVVSDGRQTSRRWLGFFVRLGVSSLVLAILLWWLPIQQLIQAIADIPLVIWFTVMLLFLLIHTIAALKWRMVLCAVDAPVGKRLAVRAHGAGLFSNLCLPSIIGGDFVRAAMVARQGSALESVAVGSLADRLNDTIALVLIAAIGAWHFSLSNDSLTPTQSNLLLMVALLLFGGVIAGVIALFALPAAYLPAKLQKVVSSVRASVQQLMKRPLTGFFAMALSMTLQCCLIGLNIVLAEALGLSLHWALWCFAWPMAKLISLVPVSLGGIGVRDAALVTILAPYVPIPALVLAQSLSWQFVLIVCGILAGLMVAFVPANLISNSKQALRTREYK